MGLQLAKIFGSKKIRLSMVGLDAAGKTTLLYKLRIGEIYSTMPTIGFSIENVDHKRLSFYSWDIGGNQQNIIRLLSKHYFQNSDGVVFMIDSNDRDRFDEARTQLHAFMSEEYMSNAKLLVLANKQDLPQAASTIEVVEALDLTAISQQDWYCQGICAKTGEGLGEGFEWLSSKIQNLSIKEL